jgi:cobalamin biosynthesis protein CobT
MGNNSSRTETINWDKIKTDDVTAPDLYLGSNPNNANVNNLITKLNLPKDLLKDNLETETEIDLLDRKVQNNHFVSLNELNSSTSPFISSDKYLALTNKLQNNLNQLGGALDDESSTSITEDNTSKNNIAKDNITKNNVKSKFKSMISELSYISSSAHTGNDSVEEDDEEEEEEEDNNDDNESDESDKTTPELKNKYKSQETSEVSNDDESEVSNDDEDSNEETDEDNLGNSTVYSTTIDNEVNTSDINLA